MIKSLAHALQKYTLMHLPRYSPLIIKHSFSSSQSFESLKSSDFAKELGLDQEFKQVIKMQKKNESNKLQISALLIVFTFLSGGTMIIVSMIDSNEWKGFKYRVKKIVGMEGDGNKSEEKVETNQYEKNLRQIFDKNFKGRSTVDTKFLRYVEDCVGQNINKLKQIKTGQNSSHINLKDDLTYIIQNLTQKFFYLSEQKMKSQKHPLLSICEKIVYHELKVYESSNRSESSFSQSKSLKEPELNLCIKLSKFLLIKGSLNQQILGLKYLFSLKSFPFQNNTIKPLQSSITQLTDQQITTIRQRIKKNRQTYEKSFNLSNHQSLIDQKQPGAELGTRIIKVKEQIMYSVEELKRVNELQKNKILFLEETFSKLLEKSKDNKSKDNKRK